MQFTSKQRTLNADPTPCRYIRQHNAVYYDKAQLTCLSQDYLFAHTEHQVVSCSENRNVQFPGGGGGIVRPKMC